MKKVLIDLNVLLDFLNKRESHEYAAEVVDLCVTKKIRGYVCAHEITTLAYFLLKEYSNREKVRFVLNELLNIFTILPVAVAVLRNALNSRIDDYEDAVIEECGITEKVDVIITRDLSDFTKSRVPAQSPGEFLAGFDR